MNIDKTELTTATSSTQLECIGRGECGTVWADPGPAGDDIARLVMKREEGGDLGHPVAIEYQVYRRLVQASQNMHPLVINSFSIPSCHEFLDKDNIAWSEILPRLPPNSAACNALINEKIRPLPLSARSLLMQQYYQNHDQDAVRNTHCLVRPYLGRRRRRSSQHGQPRFRVFNLRKFPLHQNLLAELDLDLEGYATAMADALAFLHWCARVDADGVEFVLAPPRPRRQPQAQAQAEAQHPSAVDLDGGTPFGPGTATLFDSPVLGPHALWLLDFNSCQEMAMDPDGMRQAAACFWRNDPYYPRPGGVNALD
ncbi:hypothetical protein QBC33DRAFT_338203 [Phialemonium atrogriseum]|uniref:DUF3669 domain-containing protein n=1 Tax=Phialemonium atrogriseum TaxID=1093897 RepID=A0AAJ0FQC6_9PEZI|nr:uncharacterized protein QBC33DRAFT_338203 [Phialemonium atrogriseum]KAK1769020.1 hypothetical protein QBC33DRAFT_338203 [Phialemonium atrogriseum]